MKISVTINGQLQQLEIRGSETLLDTLRDAGYYSVKRGCENGDCGSCGVLVDGKSVCSCLMMAGQVHDRTVTTVEALGDPHQPHPLQEEFVQCGAAQCGFCIPAMILSAKALLDHCPSPSQAQLEEAIDGNLCRCTGYVKPYEAIHRAARRMEKCPPPALARATATAALPERNRVVRRTALARKSKPSQTKGAAGAPKKSASRPAAAKPVKRVPARSAKVASPTRKSSKPARPQGKAAHPSKTGGRR